MIRKRNRSQTTSVSALLVGIFFAIQLSGQDRAKPKTATPSDSAGVGITKDQADGILEELRQIRQLLEKQQAQLDRVVTPQPSVPGAPQKVQMSVKSTWRSLGRADAPITLVEFADYECPFCKSFHTSTYAELKKNYIDTGKVRFVSSRFAARIPSYSVERSRGSPMRRRPGQILAVARRAPYEPIRPE